MALNRDKVGTSYPPFTYEVTRAKIHEYATALGETDPRFLSDGDDCVAPPTFAACFTLVQGGAPAFADPDLGTHEVLVHGTQAYRYGTRPMRPGDVLTCTTTVGDISARGSNEFLVLEVDCRFADSDELAVRSEATIVFLGSAPAKDTTTSTEVAGADAPSGAAASGSTRGPDAAADGATTAEADARPARGAGEA